MSTPDRLTELQRQRALVQQHLAWLDREIQAAQPGQPPAPPLVPFPSSPVAPAPTAAFTPRPAIPDADAEAIIDRYRTDEKSLKGDVRKGCLLYAIGAFVVLGVGIFGLYLLLRH